MSRGVSVPVVQAQFMPDILSTGNHDLANSCFHIWHIQYLSPAIQMIAITTVLIIRKTLVEIRQMIIESTLESYEFIHSLNVFICVAEDVDTQWNWGHYGMIYM